MLRKVWDSCQVSWRFGAFTPLTKAHLPLQAARIERRPSCRSIVIRAEDVETRYPRRLRGSLGQLVGGVGHQGNEVEEFLHRERDGEEVFDEG